MGYYLPTTLQRNRARTNKKPYRVTCNRGVLTLWKCNGGLAFFVASAFTLDELAKYVPTNPKARSAGVPQALAWKI